MDQRLQSILANIPEGELTAVAAAATGGAVTTAGAVTLTEITTSHADNRTIGIVRVSGKAVSAVDSLGRPWSAVVKLIDLAIPALWKDPVSPENELLVYERGHLTRAGLRMRPAHCYHVSRPDEWIRLLWLEDLTDAKGAPFAVDELAHMARHLGEWNVAMATDPPQLEFLVDHDFQVRSWDGWLYPERAADLVGMDDDPMARAMYSRQPLEMVTELVEVFGQLVEQSKALPHALALADCPIGNFFYRPGETIAIDLAGVGNEPLGADGGRFIGSAITWGRRFADVAEHERELFECYATGAFEGGFRGSRHTLRSAYLSELGFYLANLAVFPTVVSGPRALFSPAYFERRYQWPMNQLGDEAVRVIALLPSYIAEVRQLLR